MKSFSEEIIFRNSNNVNKVKKLKKRLIID